MQYEYAILIVLFLLYLYKQKEGYDEISVPSEVIFGNEKPISVYQPVPYFGPTPPYNPREIASVRNSWGDSLSGLYNPQPNFYLPWTNPEGRKPSTIAELQTTKSILQHGEYSTNHDGLYPY